jgi:excisionase family DNA binding protein
MTTIETKERRNQFNGEIYARPMAERPYRSVREVAEYMGNCSQAVISWIKKGDLEGYKVGISYRIPNAAFEELKRKFPKEVSIEE